MAGCPGARPAVSFKVMQVRRVVRHTVVGKFMIAIHSTVDRSIRYPNATRRGVLPKDLCACKHKDRVLSIIAKVGMDPAQVKQLERKLLQLELASR